MYDIQKKSSVIPGIDITVFRNEIDIIEVRFYVNSFGYQCFLPSRNMNSRQELLI